MSAIGGQDGKGSKRHVGSGEVWKAHGRWQAEECRRCAVEERGGRGVREASPLVVLIDVLHKRPKSLCSVSFRACKYGF